MPSIKRTAKTNTKVSTSLILIIHQKKTYEDELPEDEHEY